MTWARGTVPTSTGAATTETSCQKGTAAASGAAGARWTPLFFYLLCFSCTGQSAMGQPHNRAAPSVQSGGAAPCYQDAVGRDPLPVTWCLWELLPRVTAVVAQQQLLTYSLGDADRFLADFLKRLLSRCTV